MPSARLACLPFAAALLVAAPGCTGSGGKSATCELEFTDSGSVRVFVVGHKFLLDDAATYRSFERSFRRDMEAIAPCRSSDRENLVLFPEDSGLLAWFIGSRGEAGRGQDTSENAFFSIFGQYQDPAAHYQQTYPGISLPRALTLSLGDVAWRAMNRTFGGIAEDWDVWVVTSANLPEVELSEVPALVELLGDPDLGGEEGVFVATGPECFNKALLYSPDGELVGTVNKVYLTDPEEQILDLSNGSLAALSTFDLPFAHIGAAISRDAFYPPFLQRMEDLGVDFVVQPEAWTGWTVEEHTGYWEPDAILASGWVHTQKYRGFRHNATPMFNGNLFEAYFDGQVWLTKKAAPEDTDAGFVGSRAGPGWLAIGPWAYEDSVAGTLAERQAALRALGEGLLPGSGAPGENAYASGLVAADLFFFAPDEQPPAVPVTPSGGSSTTPLAPGTGAHQTNPDVAFDGAGRFHAIWVEGGDLLASHSDDDGTSWSGIVGASPVIAPITRAALAAGPGVVATAFSYGGIPPIFIAVTVSTNGGASFRTAADLPTGGIDPAIAVGPAGEIAVAWSDVLDSNGDETAPKLTLAVSTNLGLSWSLPQAIDPSNAVTETVDGSQFQPAIAYSGTHLGIAWIDYRERDWHVWATVDTGGGFGAAARASDDASEEVLAADPLVIATTGGGFALAWDEIRERRGHADVRGAVFAAGAGWTATPPLDGGAQGGSFSSRFRPALAWRGAGAITAVFQDTSFRKSALATADLALGGPTVRADDTAEAPLSLTRPRIAARPGGPAVVVFEDHREGWTRIYVLRSP